jgi:predicted phosphate transport protein (TIGR00153 family)
MDNRFLNRFLPSNDHFFHLLNAFSEVADRASGLLLSCVSSVSADHVALIYSRIKTLENEGDAIGGRIIIGLNTMFTVPFDREDISDLAGSIEDVTDGINSAAKRIALYRPRHVPLEILEAARLIREATEWIKDAVPLLENLRQNVTHISRACDMLHDIENRADSIHEDFIIRLFEEESDIVELIKLKDISGRLERVTDIAYGIGKSLRRIIVKHA